MIVHAFAHVFMHISVLRGTTQPRVFGLSAVRWLPRTLALGRQTSSHLHTTRSCTAHWRRSRAPRRQRQPLHLHETGSCSPPTPRCWPQPHHHTRTFPPTAARCTGAAAGRGGGSGSAGVCARQGITCVSLFTAGCEESSGREGGSAEGGAGRGLWSAARRRAAAGAARRICGRAVSRECKLDLYACGGWWHPLLSWCISSCSAHQLQQPQDLQLAGSSIICCNLRLAASTCTCSNSPYCATI